MARNDRRVAIITGGSQGIGASLVRPTAGKAGRWWPTPARSSPQDPDVLTVEGDITEPPPPTGSSAERWSGSAASTPWSTTPASHLQAVHRLHRRDYALVVGVNLTGFFWLTQRVIAEMLKRYGGHVVNISATLAEVAAPARPRSWPR